MRQEMWSHHDHAHAAGDYQERTESGEIALFHFDPLVLEMDR